MNRYLWPLVIFVGVSLLLWRGLSLNPREIPSALIDKPAPTFSLPTLHQPELAISRDTLKGKVWVLNVWASWCVACLHEHPIISQLSGKIDLVGLNYKDTRSEAIKWLEQNGNPYNVSAFDQAGDVGIDYGVYGVPETFVIDQVGKIRYKHIGPVTQEDLDGKLIPAIAEIRDSGSKG
ncbi:MAG: DsbE family thiol:disulfide interchange protein [Acidiferrobacterales bacterium]|nr:DsbE family thiol:disulfide interchange protein [Acidiferrobacterales bacterium]